MNLFRSGSYQIRTSLPTEKQQTLLNHITPHSGVILEPSTAGQQSLQRTGGQQSVPSTLVTEKKPNKILKGVTAASISGKKSLYIHKNVGTQSIRSNIMK